jgi:hypothetical protein
VLERDEIIGRVIDDADLVEKSAVVRVRESDIALGTAVEGGLVSKFVVNADQSSIFVYGCSCSVGK